MSVFKTLASALVALSLMVSGLANAGVDPVQPDPSTGANFNRYAYANNNPYKFVDPDGRRSTVKDDKINIDVEDKSLPTITIPNTVGAKGISPADKNDHAYDVRTGSSLTPSQAAQGFKNNPTPGNDSPASPMGTLNNVGNIPTAGDTNMVRSFSVASPDPAKYTDITVNYTVAGQHGLHEGFVVRYGEIGASGVTLRSYGEGSNSRQSMNYRDLPLIGWGAKVDAVWQQNHQEIINGSR